MMKIAFWSLLLYPLSAIAQEKLPGNPAPLFDDLTLPLPGSRSLVFRPVAVGPDKGAFQTRVFKIGDRAEGGFQEFPTDISVGGAVSMTMDGQKQWVYFLGKYEITESQWFAVMGGGSEEEQGSEFPKRSVSWFEVQEFVNKANQWLFANALGKLPENQGSPCFLRLPTEAEWEFASRGGSNVSANEFDRKHPYEGPLTEFEWFSGPRSSNDKVKRIGRKKSNPLGIHDMLGNVAEMTCTQYSVEYFQGRVGGMVIRGGHYFTSEDKIRASARDEFPIYNPENQYQPRRIETLGLRLVLSSPIFINPHIHSRMEEEWETYRKVRTVPTLASPSAPNRAAQASGRINEIATQLEKLQRAIATDPTSPDVKDALGLAMGSAQNIQADANGVQSLLTQTLLDACYVHGHSWGLSLASAQIIEKALHSGKATQREKIDFLEQIKIQYKSADMSADRYAESIRRLGGTDEAMSSVFLKEKIETERKRPAEEKSDDAKELQVLQSIQKHSAHFRKNQRFDEKQAEADFFKIYSATE